MSHVPRDLFRLPSPSTGREHALRKDDLRLASNNIVYNHDYRRPSPQLSEEQRLEALQSAAATGQTHRVKQLLALGTDTWYVDDEGLTALHRACLNDHEEVVNLLLEHGADVNSESPAFGAPIVLAAAKGHHSVVRLLLRYRAKINTFTSRLGSVLHAACFSGDAEIIQILLAAGADADRALEVDLHALLLLDAEDGRLRAQEQKQRLSPIRLAIVLGQTQVLEALLNYPVKLELVDLVHAIKLKNPEALDLLLDRKHRVADFARDGGRLMLLAAREGLTEHVSALLRHGVDVNVVDAEGRSALMIAALQNNVEMAKFLFEADADQLLVDRRGSAALSLSLSANGITVPQWLQSLENSSEATPSLHIEDPLVDLNKPPMPLKLASSNAADEFENDSDSFISITSSQVAAAIRRFMLEFVKRLIEGLTGCIGPQLNERTFTMLQILPDLLRAYTTLLAHYFESADPRLHSAIELIRTQRMNIPSRLQEYIMGGACDSGSIANSKVDSRSGICKQAGCSTSDNRRSETDLSGFNPLASDDDLNIADDPVPQSLHNFAQVRERLTQNSAWTWLISRLSTLLRPTAQLPEHTIMAALEQSDEDSVQLKLKTSWNPRHFLDVEYAHIPNRQLNEIITLTAADSDAGAVYAVTCEQYVLETWPLFGPQVLRMIECLLRPREAELGARTLNKTDDSRVNPTLGAKSPKPIDHNRNATLIHAAEEGDVGMIHKLLSSSGKSSIEHRHIGAAIHCAAENGHYNAVRLLVAAGGDVRTVDPQGYTPIERARQHRALDFVKVTALLSNEQEIFALRQLGPAVAFATCPFAAELPRGLTVEVFLLNQQLCVVASSDPAILSDLESMISWLCASLRKSTASVPCFSRIDEEPLPATDDNISSGSLPAMFLKPSAQILHGSSSQAGQCWLELFGNVSIATGFPIPWRHHAERGLETTADIMLALGKTPWATTHNEAFMLKGFSSMFVPKNVSDGSTTWHYQVKPDGSMIPFSDGIHSALRVNLVSSVDVAELLRGRQFIGWTTNVQSRFGTSHLDYSTISRPNANFTSAGMVLDKVTIGASQYLNMNASIARGQSQQPVHAPSTDDFLDNMNYARQSNIVLYDSEKKRAWLTDGTSAVLHITCSQLASDSFVENHNLRKFSLDQYVPDTVVPFELLKSWAFRKIILRRKAADESNGKHYYMESLVASNWQYIAQMIEHQNKPRSGVNIHLTDRHILEGWAFSDVVDRRMSMKPRYVLLEPSGRGWTCYLRKIEAVTLLGEGFGDLMISKVGKSCSQLSRVPAGKDFLAAPLSRLKYNGEVYGNAKDYPAYLADGVKWHQAESPFADCRCQGRACAPIQMVIPDMSWRLEAPGNLEAHPDGAVIFGRSERFRFPVIDSTRKKIYRLFFAQDPKQNPEQDEDGSKERAEAEAIAMGTSTLSVQLAPALTPTSGSQSTAHSDSHSFASIATPPTSISDIRDEESVAASSEFRAGKGKQGAVPEHSDAGLRAPSAEDTVAGAEAACPCDESDCAPETQSIGEQSASLARGKISSFMHKSKSQTLLKRILKGREGKDSRGLLKRVAEG